MAKSAYINGHWFDGKGDWFEKTNPATGETSWDGQASSDDQVTEAVAAARKAQSAWARRPQHDRTTILEAYAEEIAKRSDAVAEAISRDMGKVAWDANGEAGAMAAKVGISIKAQAERAGTAFSDAAFGSMHLTHRPHGVMAVFGPFNFPGHLPNGHIVPALLAGNACVLKPSELAPSVAHIMVEAFEAA
ncbi:MAG: aldehyde dehydrogenase family protein, partial [Pseudomonadota bacterium]